jgi:cell division protein FtsL
MTMLDTPVRPRRQPGPAPRHAYATRGAAAMAVAPERAPQRPRPEARPNHLRVVAPTERVRRRLTPATAVILTAALFATLLAVAVAHTVLVQGQVRLDELDAQLSAEQARYQELRKDVAELESPARVVGAAQEQGMVIPEDLQYLQPPAMEVAATADAGGSGGSDVASAAGDGTDRAWSEVKPMLEDPAP